MNLIMAEADFYALSFPNFSTLVLVNTAFFRSSPERSSPYKYVWQMLPSVQEPRHTQFKSLPTVNYRSRQTSAPGIKQNLETPFIDEVFRKIKFIYWTTIVTGWAILWLNKVIKSKHYISFFLQLKEENICQTGFIIRKIIRYLFWFDSLSALIFLI